MTGKTYCFLNYKVIVDSGLNLAYTYQHVKDSIDANRGQEAAIL